jgi:predicted DCC family thiol-disulfide oxidoreductase YuxK
MAVFKKNDLFIITSSKLGEDLMKKVTVWYDGACPLCLREIALMRRLDRRDAIDFVNLADDQTSCPIDRNLLLARLHAMENGTMLSGAAAFAAMWRAIPLLRPLGLLARISLVLNGLERLYVAFLRIRPRLQKLVKTLDSK